MIYYRVIILKSRTVSLHIRCLPKILRGKAKFVVDYDFATEIETKGKKKSADNINGK